MVDGTAAAQIQYNSCHCIGLMVQLLHKYSITAAESSVKLLKVIKNPITDHLPPGQLLVMEDLRVIYKHTTYK